MIWLLIVFILALVVGPILYLMPSPRQKEQIAFRNEARSRGISVKISTIEDPHPQLNNYLSATGKSLQPVINCIAYSMSRKKPVHWQSLEVIEWKLIKAQEVRSETGSYGWVLEAPGAQLPEVLQQALAREQKWLPEDAIVVTETNYVVSVYWHERGGAKALQGVCTFLENMALVETPPLELE